MARDSHAFIPAPATDRVLPAPQSGRTLRMQPAGDGADAVTVVDPEGNVELSIRLTRDGPVVTLKGAQLELEATRSLAIRCHKLDIEVERDASVRTGEGWNQSIGGDRSVRVEGRSSFEAYSSRMTARRGDVEIKANDDVHIDGERVWLNR